MMPRRSAKSASDFFYLPRSVLGGFDWLLDFEWLGDMFGSDDFTALRAQ